MSPTMREDEARVFWEWLMVSDPWPLSKEKRARMEDFANKLAYQLGYRDHLGNGDWIAAYHDNPPSPYPEGWQFQQ